MNIVKFRLRGLNSTIATLGIVSFFTDLASEMLYPITPIFLSSILSASMTELGMIEGLAEALAQLLKAYSGLWSDRISNRKNFILFGYSLSALAKPMIGLASGIGGVFLGRTLDRIGKGVRVAPRDALIADSINNSTEIGAAYGWHRLMDTLGAFIGPLVTLYLLGHRQMSIRSIYFWTLIPGLLSILAVLFLKEIAVNKKLKPAGVFKFNEIRWPGLNGDFKRFIIYFSVFSLANSSDAFLILQAKNCGISIENTILLYCGYNLVYALMSPVLGKRADSSKKKNVLAFGFFVYAAVYLGFAFSRELLHFALLFAAYGVYMAATDGVGKALAVELSGNENRATAIGFLGAGTGICAVISSVGFGLVWDAYGPQPAFLICSLAAGIAALLFAFGSLGRNHSI